VHVPIYLPNLVADLFRLLQPATSTRDSVLHADALASVPRALTALVYSHHSLPKARKWVHAFFFSRDVDLRPMLKFTDPKKALQDTVSKFGRARPVSRLLKETGRYSNSPVFVVGIYAGADELGQGFGSSLKMAEYRAAEDALHRLYLTRTPAHALALPTSTFPTGAGGLFDPETLAAMAGGAEAGAYVPPALGEQEVLYASAGRSRIVLESSA
jgi:large subunit ribosomal protein L44